MSDYHEPSEELTAEDRDLHRALTSLKEEIEAVDWYQQRVALTKNEALRGVLAHNRDEEIEHACMTLEWLRRSVPKWHDHLSTYLFSSHSIVELEAGGSSRSAVDDGRGLGIGDLSIHEVAGHGIAGADLEGETPPDDEEEEDEGETASEDDRQEVVES